MSFWDDDTKCNIRLKSKLSSKHLFWKIAQQMLKIVIFAQI